MTILSKKKPHNKNEDDADSPQSSYTHSVTSTNSPNHTQQSCSDNANECHWPSSSMNTLEVDSSGVSSCIMRSSPIMHGAFHERRNSQEWSPPSSPSSSSEPGPSNVAADEENYNSEDEYVTPASSQTEEEWREQQMLFEKWLNKCGFIIKKMKEDGSCLFRAVADQVFGDEEMHDVARQQCMDYIAANRDHYSQYVTEDFNTYVRRKRMERTHGNHIEIQAMCEIYNRRIEVYRSTQEPINIFRSQANAVNMNEPIRLSYERRSHYNSIVNPYKPSVGVGLGLPNHSSGSADNSGNDVARQSEAVEIEQTMLEDKLRATDWEATNEAIEEQVARESYLQWCRDNEARMRAEAQASKGSYLDSDSAGPSTESYGTGTTSGDVGEVAKNDGGDVTSDAAENSSLKNGLFAGASVKPLSETFSPELFGLQQWEDMDDMLSDVFAQSQQEYLDNLKKQKQEEKEGEKMV